jgi:prevent-host-death family protein
MRQYSLTELNNRSGEVVEAAYNGPVGITKRGKTKFVIMTADQYEQLRKSGDQRRAFTLDAMPKELEDGLLDLADKYDREGWHNY